MRYYKHTENGYIVSVGTGNGNTEISLDEYSALLQTIQDRPIPANGQGLRLTKALKWEAYDLPKEDTDPELSDAAALDILLEVLTHEKI